MTIPKVSELKLGQKVLFQHSKSSWSSTFELEVHRFSKNKVALEYSRDVNNGSRIKEWALVKEIDEKYTFIDFIE